jgi:hypothetical protein
VQFDFIVEPHNIAGHPIDQYFAHLARSAGRWGATNWRESALMGDEWLHKVIEKQETRSISSNSAGLARKHDDVVPLRWNVAAFLQRVIYLQA